MKAYLPFQGCHTYRMCDFGAQVLLSNWLGPWSVQGLIFGVSIMSHFIADQSACNSIFDLSVQVLLPTSLVSDCPEIRHLPVKYA